MSCSRNTSISMSACFRPWIRIDNIRYFLLWHNYVRMVYIVRMIGHVLCTVLFLLNGFIPSVLKINLIFLLTTPNCGYWRSKNFHWVPSVGCRISSSFSLWFTECQHTSSASLGLENTCFKRSISGRYHITKAEIFLFILSSLSGSVLSSTLSGLITVLFLFYIIFLIVSAYKDYNFSCIDSRHISDTSCWTHTLYGIKYNGWNMRVFYPHLRTMDI
jgi:hypothetical protein